MSSNKTGVITYTGIQDLENAISGDSVAMAFRLPTTVTSLTKSKNKSLVIPTTKGGVTMMTGVNIKKTGAVLLLLLALGTIIASLSVNNSFSMPGAVIIVFFSILIAFLFWTDDRERKV
ncbi:hypothetical protein RW092_17405 [Paenibacillus sp. 3LSP]|uniref:hypothetical protein n=1 Tax=Paenibacillus TaxID=44249 RepID=UPI0028FD2572|nr:MULTISPECIES: hypothetical protein [Paenibacillus]MDU0331957.1 hypothetical protein [Paenibacillus sp. 3LSP]MEC2345954.1 hypothetical protein [Paenibacillus barengoltzii]